MIEPLAPQKKGGGPGGPPPGMVVAIAVVKLPTVVAFIVMQDLPRGCGELEKRQEVR